MKLSRIKFFLAVCTLLVSLTAYAQDNHRWTNQFGTRSALMGGAVVGNADDTSAVYYNPGSLGFLRDNSVSVSANALRVESLKRENAVGDGIGYDQETVNVVPLMVSGVHIFEDLPNLVFGYTMLTKNSTAFHDTQRLDEVVDVISSASFPGVEDTILQSTTSNDLDEYWGGLGVAGKLTDNISIGITNFLALRQQKNQNNAQLRVINEELFSVASIDQGESFDYWNLRLLWKAGVAAKYDGMRFGLTATSPSISLTGDGTSSRDYTTVNLDLDGDGIDDSFVANDRKEDLDAKYKSPFSLAGGVEVDLADTTRLGASVEWFGTLGLYNVASTNSTNFLRPSGVFAGLIDGSDFLNVVDAADNIVNFSVALEQELSEEFTGYLAFRSDYETYRRVDHEVSRQLGFTNWDLYHVTLGTTWAAERSTLALGVEYSFGSNSEAQEDAKDIDNDYDAISIIMGYTYHFGDVVQEVAGS